MSRQLLSKELCGDCRKIYYTQSATIEWTLNSKAYIQQDDQPGMYLMMNKCLLKGLIEKGGCRDCIALLKQVTQ